MVSESDLLVEVVDCVLNAKALRVFGGAVRAACARIGAEAGVNLDRSLEAYTTVIGLPVANNVLLA